MAFKKCWAYGFNDSIKWAIQNGKQRYKCKRCGMLFCWDNEAVSDGNRFVWFYKRIMVTLYKNLVRDSGMSQSSIQRLFKRLLEDASTVPTRK